MSSKVRREHPEYDFAEAQQHIAKLWKNEKQRYQGASCEANASNVCINDVPKDPLLLKKVDSVVDLTGIEKEPFEGDFVEILETVKCLGKVPNSAEV